MLDQVQDNLTLQWFSWHFKDAPSRIFQGWKNFLKFSIEFFSIIPLLKTLFSPWKRISDSYHGGIFNIGENLQIFITNSFSRVLGFLVRSFVIFFGFLFTIIVFLFGLVTIVIWFILPLLIFLGFLFSLMFLF